MLYILNTRRSLRLGDTSGIGNSSLHGPSRGRTGREVELGVLSGIQVHTQIESSRNRDVCHAPPNQTAVP